MATPDRFLTQQDIDCINNHPIKTCYENPRVRKNTPPLQHLVDLGVAPNIYPTFTGFGSPQNTMRLDFAKSVNQKVGTRFLAVTSRSLFSWSYTWGPYKWPNINGSNWGYFTPKKWSYGALLITGFWTLSLLITGFLGPSCKHTAINSKHSPSSATVLLRQRQCDALAGTQSHLDGGKNSD